MRIHKEGYWYIVIASLLWLGIGYMTCHFLANYVWLIYVINIIVGLLWFWVLWFFRIPNRTLTIDAHQLICPADGKVVVIEEVNEPEFFKDTRLQVSIFMSPLNVHVNRNPSDGKVAYFKYHPGKFLVAWHPKSSTMNERTTMVIDHPKGGAYLVRQIAGALARRICYYVKPGDAVQQNGEFGFIKFGSRVDVFLPLGTKVLVSIGDKVQGGVTPLAKLD